MQKTIFIIFKLNLTSCTVDFYYDFLHKKLAKELLKNARLISNPAINLL